MVKFYSKSNVLKNADSRQKLKPLRLKDGDSTKNPEKLHSSTQLILQDNSDMEIVTAYGHQLATRFRQLKRKTHGEWVFLVSGEWSQTPFHQGNCSFNIRSTDDRRHWALMSRGFPNRIVAVAHSQDECPLEFAGAKMMRAIRQAEGDYIDKVHQHGDINLKKLWDIYVSDCTDA